MSDPLTIDPSRGIDASAADRDAKIEQGSALEMLHQLRSKARDKLAHRHNVLPRLGPGSPPTPGYGKDANPGLPLSPV